MNIEQELEALHTNLLANTDIRYVSQKQLGGLNGLIRKGVEDKSREMRIAILEKWAGEPMRRIANVQEFTTSKNITSPVATFLINLLIVPDSSPWKLSQYGKELIRETEKLVLRENSYEKV